MVFKINFSIVLIALSVTVIAQQPTDSLIAALKGELKTEKRVDVFNRLADNLMTTNLDSARFYADKAYQLATQIDYNEGVIRSLNQKSLYYLNTSKFDSAKFASTKAIDICKQQNIKSLLAESFRQRADIYQFLNFSDSAEFYYLLAEQNLVYVQNELDKAAIYNNYANCLESKNQYDKALDYYLKSLAIFKEAGQKSKEASIISNIGNIYSFRNQHEKALELFKEALSINLSLDNKAGIAMNYSNLGYTYRNLKQYDKSIENHLLSLELNKKLNKKSELIRCYYNLGVTYGQDEKFEQAITNYHQSIKIAEETGFEIGFLYNSFGLGRIYLKLNDKILANKYLNKALALSEKFNIPDARLNCYQELYRLNKQNGLNKEALYYFEKYQTLKDSIFTTEKEQIVSDLQTKYETEKKELLISELKHKEFVNRMTIRTVILALIILLTVLLLIVFYFQKRKIIYRQKLTIKQQEIDKMKMTQDANKQELTSKALLLAKSEEIILHFKNEIEQVLPSADSNLSGQLKDILHKIQWDENSKGQWKEFVNRFDELNNGFIGKLIERYPNLSPVELRLCAMLRLQLSTKDIAELSNRSVRTVENTRTNIRKKMDLDATVNLTTFLLAI